MKPTSTKLDQAATPRQRPVRLLWANYYCLLDTSSGASMSAHQMLLQLHKAGFEVSVLGATVFDHERGNTYFQPHSQQLQASQGQLLKVWDGVLTHQLLVTQHWQRSEMRLCEITAWHAAYRALLDEWQPDCVWFYGGQPVDYLIPDEARRRGLPSAAYLVNGNYTGTRWCEDVNLIITDSQATAHLYKERLGREVKAVGKFIPVEQFVAPVHERQHLVFINPSLTKGAAIVAQLALLLEKRRPEITFEIVQSRGQWQPVLEWVSAAYGKQRSQLDNVILTPTTQDMRPVYQRARVLLAPSLWWESGARVLAEAMLNGIPAIVTDRGGSPEMIQEGGLRVALPEACYQKPYQQLPDLAMLEPLVQQILRFWDDEAYYQSYVERAYQVGQRQHNITVNTHKLVKAFEQLLNPEKTRTEVNEAIFRD